MPEISQSQIEEIEDWYTTRNELMMRIIPESEWENVKDLWALAASAKMGDRMREILLARDPLASLPWYLV